MFRKKPPIHLPPEWLIVGLGNPGAEYRGTRHNVGFEVVEALAAAQREKLNKVSFRALTCTTLIRGETVVIAKPLTYMNLSGQAIAPLMKQANLKPDRVLVIADETSLPLGKLRLRADGSAGGHNGHKSIIQALGTQEYPRLRIGIGQAAEAEGNTKIDHVLGSFTGVERDKIERAVKEAVKVCEILVKDGMQAALHEVERANSN